MHCYQLTLPESDETDDLIKWVKAPSREILDTYLQKRGIICDDIEQMGEHASEYTKYDGVDLELDHNGNLTDGMPWW